jgi:hypothetical protein
VAIRSGIGGQFGYAAESTYGTGVAVTKFPAAQTANIKDTSTYAFPNGFAAGRTQPLGSRVVQTGEGGTANVTMPVWTKQMGLLLQALMGTSVTPVIIGAGPGYTQTHVLADPFGKSLTLQTGTPEGSTGTARPHTLFGAKPTSATFSIAQGADSVLMSEWEFVGREFDTAQALATATELASTAFGWASADVKLGATVGAAAHVEGVKGVSVQIQRPSNVERNYAGNLGKISEPILNDYGEDMISGSLDIDFVTKADFVDRWHNHTSFALVLTCTAGTFTGGTETFEIQLPQVYLQGETPNLDGPEVPGGSMPFVTTFDGTNFPTIKYVSQEAAL